MTIVLAMQAYCEDSVPRSSLKIRVMDCSLTIMFMLMMRQVLR